MLMLGGWQAQRAKVKADTHPGGQARAWPGPDRGAWSTVGKTGILKQLFPGLSLRALESLATLQRELRATGADVQISRVGSWSLQMAA